MNRGPERVLVEMDERSWTSFVLGLAGCRAPTGTRRCRDRAEALGLVADELPFANVEMGVLSCG